MNNLAAIQAHDDHSSTPHPQAANTSNNGFLELLEGGPSAEEQSFESVRAPSDHPASAPRPMMLETYSELPDEGLDLRATVEAYENRLLLAALERTGWNKTRAAVLLGLNRTTLVEMLRRKGFKTPEGLPILKPARAATVEEPIEEPIEEPVEELTEC